jgi:8-oxo-dGTP diphosphatase
MKRQHVFKTSTSDAYKNRLFVYCPICSIKFDLEKTKKNKMQKCDSCGYINYINPYPGIVVIINDSHGNVLIGKRTRSSSYGNKWCLPGGFIEYDEDYISAAKREVIEETGFNVRIKGITNIISNLLDDKHHTLVIVLIADISGGLLKASDDIIELKWINEDEADKIDFAFEADIQAIKMYFHGNYEVITV